MSAEPAKWRTLLAGAVLIVLVTVMAYLPALRGGFVFDDNVLITDNPIIKAPNGLYRFWFTTDAPDYYPLTWTLWWLEWRLWDGNATGYHVVNVLLHAINAVLVWIILRQLKIPGAWLAGLVFAVHPVNVATVAWISEQKNTLSMLFYLTAILLYLRFDEDGRWRWYGLSLVAFLLALLGKTAVVMLPVVLLGCMWWRHGRVQWKDVLRNMPFFVLSLILGLVTIWFQYNRASLGRTIQTAGFASRLVAAGWAPWFYLYKVLLPFNLSMVYPKWNMDASRWVCYVPGMILIGCLTCFWWKRRTWGRAVLFGLGYFVVMLFPVLGFFDQAYYRVSLVADHWQYCSIVGVIALVVAAGERSCRRYSHVVGMVLLVVLGAATWIRSCVYADDETLWRDAVARSPKAWLARNNLGFALQQTGKITDAVVQYEQALRLKPDCVEAHNNLGSALARLGKLQEAMRHYEQALWSEPNYAEAHYNLGAALWQAGEIERAVGHYEEAIRIKPDYAEAHNNLGVALAHAGRIQGAIGHYEEALRVKPDFVEAHYNLGIVLEQVGRAHEAIWHFEQALRIRPGYIEARDQLARLRGMK